jgi:hypothetical protein
MDISAFVIFEQAVIPVFPVDVVISMNPAHRNSGLEHWRQLLAQWLLEIHVAKEYNSLGMVLLDGPKQRPPFSMRIAVEQNAQTHLKWFSNIDSEFNARFVSSRRAVAAAMQTRYPAHIVTRKASTFRCGFAVNILHQFTIKAPVRVLMHIDSSRAKESRDVR